MGERDNKRVTSLDGRENQWKKERLRKTEQEQKGREGTKVRG